MFWSYPRLLRSVRRWREEISAAFINARAQPDTALSAGSAWLKETKYERELAVRDEFS